jgi:hypothetical protein
MASKALHAAWRRSIILWCWMDMQEDECSDVVPHALATFPGRLQKAPDLRRVIPPRLDPQRVWARIAPSFGYYGGCKHLYALGAYSQFRISIHRCYKRYRGGAERGAWMDVFRRTRVRLCRILDMNFGDFPFQAVG